MSNYVTITVSVPEEHVAALYEFAARLAGGFEPPDAVGQQPATVDVMPQKPSQELVERIYAESNERQRRFLVYLANASDPWVWAHELTEALSVQPKALGGVLSGFRRRVDHRYGGWAPWESEWKSDHGENRYRVRDGSQEVADWIKAAAVDQGAS